jgi:DnaJ like chaperone protein
VGRILIKKLGWGGEPAHEDLGARIHFLMYPAILVTLKEPPHPDELKTLRKIARKWLQPVGLHHDQDMENILKAARELIEDDHASAWLQGLSHDLRTQLLLDCLNIIHSQKEIHPDKRQLVENLEMFLQLPDRAAMEFYRREVTFHRLRRPALDALGLPPDATDEQVEQSYRDAVRRFHPDRVQGVPDHLSELAREKIVEINQAYSILKSADITSLKFVYRGHQADDSFEPDGQSPFTCRCWICAQANRIPADVMLHSVRCGGCHAFLGIVPAK